MTNKNDLTPLMIAARNNDINLLAELLDQGEDIETVGIAVKYGSYINKIERTVLSYAIENSDIETVRFLLEKGANGDIDIAASMIVMLSGGGLGTRIEKRPLIYHAFDLLDSDSPPENMSQKIDLSVPAEKPLPLGGGCKAAIKCESLKYKLNFSIKTV